MGKMPLFFTIGLTYLFSNVFASVFEYPFFDTFAKWQGKGRLEGDYSAYILKNKLKVILHEHDDRKRLFEAALTVGVGSSGVSKKHPVWEQPILEGLPHLLEHCLFFSNEDFPNPNEIHKFMTLSGGYVNGTTWADHTIYELQIPHGDYVFEALKRFVSMFISPIFTKESIQTEKSIVNNEWLEHRELTRTIYERYPQLLMRKNEPSALFSCGDSTSLNGDADVLLDQVKLFWKTHYTADNMKLAISFHRSYKNDVLKILTEFFERIPTSISENTTPPLNSNPTPFWSEDHKDQYLEVYTQNERRNLLHLYWHIPCNEGAVCHDSLEMIVQSIQGALFSEFKNRNCFAYYKIFTHNQYVVAIAVTVRDVEITSLKSLKEHIIKTVRNKAPGIMAFNESHVEFRFPQYLARSLSEIMRLKGPLAQVPIRAHVKALVDESSKILNKEHWELFKKDPRFAVSYKSEFWKDALGRTTLVDPYHSIYYRFVNYLGTRAFDHAALSFKESNSVLRLQILHPPISYPFRFLKGVFIEMIRIVLKLRQLKFKSFIGNHFFWFEIHLENSEMWIGEMRGVMEALDNPTRAVMKKAQHRWLREMQYENSKLSLNSIMAEYASILISSNLFNESLISDPNPKNVDLETFKNLRSAVQKIGTLEVIPHLMSNKKTTDADIIKNMRRMWMWTSKVSQPVPYSKFKQPARGETFIYAPPPLLTTKSGVMIFFEWDMMYMNCVSLVKNILETYFFRRFRYDLTLTYTPKINTLSGTPSETHSGTYIYLSIASPHTPDYVQNRINSVITEIPDHIRKLSDKEWIDHVKDFLNDRGGEWDRNEIIEMIEYCLFEDKGSSRLIIQLWGRHQSEARDAYLNENKNKSISSTKIITTIDDYPREN